ncbi:hypothetical protein Trco_000587 [Trichoderma cornu-damae]|uniref:Uncharacterized protein n=1 Tax=Trichoderma cornu-damae TaxID=654480 RepID=A0A9P8TZZ3_9HYPO|nr:hypothetical protein Trco_000587 [Trichoderma cornu-damae]
MARRRLRGCERLERWSPGEDSSRWLEAGGHLSLFQRPGDVEQDDGRGAIAGLEENRRWPGRRLTCAFGGHAGSTVTHEMAIAHASIPSIRSFVVHGRKHEPRASIGPIKEAARFGDGPAQMIPLQRDPIPER